MANRDFYYSLWEGDSCLVSNIPENLEYYANVKSLETIEAINKKNTINEVITVSNGDRYRLTIKEEKGYKIAFISNIQDHIRSSKLSIADVNSILSRAKMIDESISKAKKEVRDNFSKFTHNLKTLCTMSIQDIEVFSPTGSTADLKISKLSDWKIYVSELESEDKTELAKTLMRIYKNMQHVQNDIMVYEYLFDGISITKKPNDHSIHKIITRSVLCCASILLEKGVRIKFGNSTWPIKIDYTSSQVALFYIMDNIIKYIKPNTDLDIKFEKNKTGKIVVIFEMESLFVEKSEEKKIFEEGYSGRHSVHANMSGKGLGMYTAKKILEENNASIIFLSTGEPTDAFLHRKYGKNKITITFN
ncbi:HAMP domain-containing histidine kinase (plasmid) [Kosakonia cowanii]|uniref:hypothetical protein n=1 Tax=Kosakonia cowanii TaxID=208223 RepID=UPI001E576B75|nr:hypothetical protein [Kosakonia cowanii]UGS48668.1 HAMP domain-containing histidine kinase [Kosakonia cowanii]